MNKRPYIIRARLRSDRTWAKRGVWEIFEVRARDTLDAFSEAEKVMGEEKYDAAIIMVEKVSWVQRILNWIRRRWRNV